MVKTTIDIPDWLWKKFSMLVIQGKGYRKKKAVIEDLIKDYVQRNGTLPSQVVDRFEAERDAFQNMRRELLSDRKYRGKFVAVLNGSVVDFDADKVALVKRTYEKYGYAPIYVDKVDQERRRAEIPSPELRRN